MNQRDDDPVLETARLAELGLMTATLAHELRQPIFALKSLVQLAERGGGHASPGSLLDQIELLERIIDSVSAFSRRDRRAPGPVDTGAVARAAVDLAQHGAKRADVELRLEVDGDPPAARADGTGLLQTLVNLLNNAIQASAPKDVVVLHIGTADQEVLIEVRDRGPGIPAELRERVFDRFFTTKEAGVGTGLGLPLARKLIESVGGELRIGGSEQGAVVQVRLKAWS